MSKLTECVLASQAKNPKVNIAFIILSAICAIIGASLFSLAMNVKTQSVMIDYTDCKNIHNEKCINILRNDPKKTCICYQSINVTANLKKPVFLSYQLNGSGYDNVLKEEYFYSRDYEQLKGIMSLRPSKDCGNFTYNALEEGKPIAPCGGLANYKFSDVIALKDDSHQDVPLMLTRLVTDGEKSNYKNPPGDLQSAFAMYAKPIDWKINVWELNGNSTDNNGFENEGFIMWMERGRRKYIDVMEYLPLYARLDHSVDGYTDGLPNGRYSLAVIYNYAVPENGTKTLVFWAKDSSISHAKLAFGIILFIAGTFTALFFLMGFILKDKDKSIEAEESHLNQ